MTFSSIVHSFTPSVRTDVSSLCSSIPSECTDVSSMLTYILSQHTEVSSVHAITPSEYTEALCVRSIELSVLIVAENFSSFLSKWNREFERMIFINNQNHDALSSDTQKLSSLRLKFIYKKLQHKSQKTRELFGSVKYYSEL